MNIGERNILRNDSLAIRSELDKVLSRNSDVDYSHAIASLNEEQHISSECFRSSYVDKNIPVVLRQAAKHWPAVSNWNLDLFHRDYGNVEVMANLYNVAQTNMTTLKSVVDAIKGGSSKQPTYLQEWWFQDSCPALLDDIIVPEHFTNDENTRLLGFSNHTLWIGQDGAFTPLHQDTVHANIWTAQIMGSKEWILIDPICSLYEGADGKPDYERFFIENKGKIFRVTLEAGDILYVPFKWWHRAHTIEPSISLNTFYVTQNIARPYIKDLLSIPLAIALNGERMRELEPMRYNISISRVALLTKRLGLDPNNVLNIDLTGKSKAGAYTDLNKAA